MPRSRPATNPLSFHKQTGQYYVTRRGKRIYLGADRDEAMEKFHRMALGQPTVAVPQADVANTITIKELANRFLTAQQANWRSPQTTLQGYKNWLNRFLGDHPRLKAEDFTVEMFASWKVSLRRRKYAPESINHFLCAVRALYRFGEDAGLLTKIPRLRRVKNESSLCSGPKDKPLYSETHIKTLLDSADLQLRIMILLGLNCGFGPKDIQDLTWDDIAGERLTLPRSKTGVCQTFLLWPETLNALNELRRKRYALIERLAKRNRNRNRSDHGHVFITRYWKSWNKDAVSEQFRKLCTNAGVPCYGFYRLRHCASTAMSQVATPHVHRKFMRHAKLQQQVTYTHAPDDQVDLAIEQARMKLLGNTTGGSEKSPEPVEVA